MAPIKPFSCISAVFVGCTILLLAPACQAVVLNDEYFQLSGGDASDQASVFATVDAGYSLARAYSFERPFLAVGNIPGCTATWIGNDPGNNSSFILTAAHCIEGAANGTGSFPLATSFSDWSGVGTGTLQSTGYVPPERYDPAQNCGGGACSDIALIEVPVQISLLDEVGQSLQPPIIYDGHKELDFDNSFVGYGSWGIGSLGSNGGLFPASGPRRAGATNIIDRVFESDKGIGTDFDFPGSLDAQLAESSVAAGDSGSAWWQQHLGLWTVVATTNGGSGTTYGTGSTGARVSQYVDWIQSIYPDVQLWSDTVLIGDINLDGVVDGDLSGSDDFSAFIADWRQPNVAGNRNWADLNEDHIVDLRDFFILRSAILSAGGGEISTQALPEPSGGVLLIAATLSFVAFRRS